MENQGSARLFEKFRNARGNCYRHVPSAGFKKMVLISGAAAQGSVRGRGVNSRTALAGIGVAIGPCG